MSIVFLPNSYSIKDLQEFYLKYSENQKRLSGPKKPIIEVNNLKHGLENTESYPSLEVEEREPVLKRPRAIRPPARPPPVDDDDSDDDDDFHDAQTVPVKNPLTDERATELLTSYSNVQTRLQNEKYEQTAREQDQRLNIITTKLDQLAKISHLTSDILREIQHTNKNNLDQLINSVANR